MAFDINDLVPGHQFLVYVGNLKMSFSKISGIENEASVETIVEGGVNDRQTILHVPRKTTGRLIFEHGVGRTNTMNKGIEISNQLGLQLKSPGMILAIAGNEIKRVYGYSGAVPVKWSLSGFDAAASQLLIDKIEIMHHGVQELPYV